MMTKAGCGVLSPSVRCGSKTWKDRSRINTEGNGDDAARRRRLATELYRPEVARLILIGEAPPPTRFFFYGDSLFLQYLRRAFIGDSQGEGSVGLVPEVGMHGPDWFLTYFRALGGWRTDVCDAPKRATRGGADEVGDCLEGLLLRWRAQPRDPDAALVVSPKRLVALLPEAVRREVTASVPPPGQWNAHRQAFLREMSGILERHFGREPLRRVAASVDLDEAVLDFEIARACAEGADETEIRRLLRGHPREAALLRAWTAGEDSG
ncbi:MAG: hypothetical protein H7Z41_11675 [Cytophagales bacterium]|nr:hypothetical protein [Armatimonadota bacterium]